MNLYKDIRCYWLLDCEPRPAQMEALSRSYFSQVRATSKLSAELDSQHYGKCPIIRDGFAYFMEMRLGKTPVALNDFVLARGEGFKRMVVLAPPTYVEDWVLEATRFGYDSLGIPSHALVNTPKGRKEAQKFVESGFGMLVIAYTSLVSDPVVKILNGWCDKETLFVCDESVQIKNYKASRTSVVLTNAKKCGRVRILTGKPQVQGPHDYYTQLKAIRVPQLSSMPYFAFRGRYCSMGGFKGKKVVGGRNEEELSKLIHENSFVAKRADWDTKLETEYMELPLDMMPEQKRVYTEMEQEFVTWVGGEAVTASMAATKHMKLQQITSGFIYDEEGKEHWLVPFEKTAKVQRILELLSNEISSKVIIIYHHRPIGEKLLEVLKEFKPAHIFKKEQSNTDNKKKFNESPECRVIVAQEQAVKYGHTLMGSPSDPCLYTIYFENTYSLDDRAQSEVRNQGSGQVAATTVVDFFSSPVERKVVRALQRKEDLSELLLSYYRVPDIHENATGA